MWPKSNRKRGEPSSSTPIFFRSARRVNPSNFPENARLNIDITALFTLEYLGLVGRLADWFSEIRVPAVLLRAVSFDLERLLARQPDSSAPAAVDLDQTTQHFERVKSLKGRLDLLLADPGSKWTTLDLDVRPTIDPDEPEGPYLRCLLDLLAFAPDGRDVILVDDRFVTRTECREGDVPLATTYDLLAHLKKAGAISDAEYLGAIHTLRASNYRYVPMEEWELSRRLSEAQLDGADLEPTEFLDDLRTSAAAALSTAENLEPPRGNDRGEWAYLLSLTGAVSKALVMCFGPETALERSHAQAYWLMENMYLDLTGIRECVRADNKQSATERAAITYASLLSTVFLVLTGHTEDLREARRQCLQWIYGAVVYPVETDSELLHTTCLAFTDMFAGGLLKNREDFEHDSEVADVYRAALCVYYEELPDIIKERLLELEHFVEALRIPVRSQITVDEHGFESMTFLEGLRTAIEEGFFEVEDVSGARVRIEARDDRVVLIQGDAQVSVSNEIVQALSASTAAEIIEQLYSWFDCPLTEPMAQLSQADSPLERAKITLRWQSGSPERRYQQLFSELDSNSAHSAELLFPVALSRLLSRYHLDGGLDFMEAAQSLLKHSLTLAFQRLSVFPVPLPSSLIAAYAALAPDDRGALFEGIEPVTPLQRFHLAHLLGAVDSDHEPLNRLLDHLQTETGKGETMAFLSLLEWSLEHFAKRRDPQLNPRCCLLLAWAHAEELFRCFRRAGIYATDLSSRFQSFKRPLAPIAARLRSNSEMTKDITYLSVRHRETLLLAGLLYATAGQPPSPQWVTVINSLVLLGPNREISPTFVEDIWKSDLVGSWLSRDVYEERLNTILSLEQPIDVSRTELERQLRAGISSLEDAPRGSAHSILFFAYLANQGDCPDWFSGAFARAYEKHGLEGLVVEDQEQFGAQTQIVALATLLGSANEATQNAFWGHLVELFRALPACDLQMTSVAYEAILALEAGSHRDSRRIRRVGERFETILKVAPTLSANLKVWLAALLFELGPEAGFPLWRAVILARATPAREPVGT